MLVPDMLREGRDPQDGILNRGPVALDRGSFKIDPKLVETEDKSRIRCPHCRWQPGRAALWTCMPAGAPENFTGGCGHSWNTFDTRGRCPGCSHQWRFTMCLRCQRWSPHDDWYEEDRGGGRK